MILPSGEYYDPTDQLQSSYSYLYVGQVHFCGEMCDSVQNLGV